jgi:hypothetical protein
VRKKEICQLTGPEILLGTSPLLLLFDPEPEGGLPQNTRAPR